MGHLYTVSVCPFILHRLFYHVITSNTHASSTVPTNPILVTAIPKINAERLCRCVRIEHLRPPCKNLLPDIHPLALLIRQPLLRIANRRRQDLAHPRAEHLQRQHALPVAHCEPDAVRVDRDHPRVQLELGLAAQQRDRELVHRARLERVVVAVAPLHDVVVRHPFDRRRVRLLVHRRRVQCHRLVVRDVAPAFAFAREQLRVEAPRDHRVDDRVVAAVRVVFLRDGEELPLAAAGSGSAAG